MPTSLTSIIQFLPAEEAVRRALLYVGKGRYGLGAGVVSPEAASPFDGTGRADCSAFACWALGVPKRVLLAEGDGSGVDWWNTDGLLLEARFGKYFRFVDSVNTPAPYEPGDLVVYGGVDLDRDGKRDRVGHVGVIVRGGPVIARCEVVHCQARTKPAVVRTTGSGWFTGKSRFGGLEMRKWRARVIRPVRST